MRISKRVLLKKWSLSLFMPINGRASPLMTGDGLRKVLRGFLQELPEQLLSLPFLITSLFRMNKYAYKDTYIVGNIG